MMCNDPTNNVTTPPRLKVQNSEFEFFFFFLFLQLHFIKNNNPMNWKQKCAPKGTDIKRKKKKKKKLEGGRNP